jgi:hypothetical protein
MFLVRPGPKGITKSSVRLVVPSVVLCVKHMFGGHPRTSALQTAAYVRLLRVIVWLLFSKGSKRN